MYIINGKVQKIHISNKIFVLKVKRFVWFVHD